MLRIKLNAIFVDDQDKALSFYTDVLGFQKSQDIPVGGPYRWITVRSTARGYAASAWSSKRRRRRWGPCCRPFCSTRAAI